MTKIEIPASGLAVSALWLRDNCPCEECRVLTTSEHRVIISSEAADLAPLSVEVIDEVLHVDWGHHRSRYELCWLESVRADSRRRLTDPQLWDREIDVPRYDHDSLEDPATFVAMADDFARLGVVVVEAMPTIPGTVETFLQRWVPVREVAFGRVHDVRADPGGYNIAHTAEALPPHNDMASYQWPPSGQVIHMLANDAVGGESIVVDGWAVCAELDEADLETLSSTVVAFRQFSETAETWTEAPLIRRSRSGAVTHLRFSNQLLQPLDPFDSETDRFYNAYHRLCSIVMDERMHHRYRTEAGQMTILHGHRVLHGRTAFEPDSGVRHLQDAYFEFEDLMNAAFRLRARLSAR